jgi:hypothetical protein
MVTSDGHVRGGHTLGGVPIRDRHPTYYQNDTHIDPKLQSISGTPMAPLSRVPQWNCDSRQPTMIYFTAGMTALPA